MAQEIWGFQGGQQAAMQDQQSSQLFQLQMAEGNQNLEAKTLENQQTRAALALQDKIAKQMQAKAAAKSGGTSSPIDDLADSNLEAANIALMNGNVVAADQYAEQGYNLKVQDADLKIKQNEIHMKDMDITSHYLESVHDPASLQAATMAMQGEFGNDYPPLTKMLQQLQAQPYDQAKVDQLKNALMDRKEKMLSENYASEERKRDADAKLDHIKAETDRLKAEAEVIRAKAAVKNGSGLGKPPSGFEWAVNKDGSPKLDEDGQPVLKAVAGGKNDPAAQKPWTGREKIFTERLMLSADQASKAIENISQLPVSVDTGIFGSGGKGGSGQGFMSASSEALRNKLTDQDVQRYNTMLAGLRRNLATIETVGMAPSGAFTETMGSIELRPGDTQLTKLSKMAELRQIVTTGMDIPLSDPSVPDNFKKMVQNIVDRVDTAVPFTQEDVTTLENSKKKTMAQVISEKGLRKGGSSGGSPPVGLLKEGTNTTFDKGRGTWTLQNGKPVKVSCRH